MYCLRIVQARDVPDSENTIINVAVLTTFPPRSCGIATFSRDLCAALGRSATARVEVIAIDELGTRAEYPPIVRWRLADRNHADYSRVAAEIGRSSVDAVLIQHEYGLFGGDLAGEMLLTFLAELPVPVVSTLHTVLSAPHDAMAEVTQRICARSAAVVAPGPRSATILADRYGVDTHKIVQIPHGVAVPFSNPGARSRRIYAPVVMSFGFLGPDKGIEHSIAAMPDLIKRYPGIRYRIVGSQHPGELRRAGDSYRRGLGHIARHLGVEHSIDFVDGYVTDAMLSDFLADCDVCLLPYSNPEQAVSGTLARAVGAGRAIVATTFRHALEVADQGGADLVPPSDPRAITAAVSRVLGDADHRLRLEDRARTIASAMRWPVVASQYEDLLRSVVATHALP